MVTPLSPQVAGQRVIDLLPVWLRRHLVVLLGELGGPLYLAGGVVRDLLRGVEPADIDLTVRDGARAWAARLAGETAIGRLRPHVQELAPGRRP